MARIIGLDLGSHSVKAVLFETTIRGYSTRLYATAKVPPGDRLEGFKAAIGELFTRQPMQADQVVVALPGPALATLPLSLPFTDTKRIEATLPFEIESALPFDLPEVVFDYQVASTQEKKSELLVGVVKKAELEALLKALQAAKVDPRVVTHPGIAYQNVLATMAPPVESPNQPVAIVDIGHERTSVAIGRPGGPLELARTFAGGGRDLTRALANEFQLSLEDAEAWKEQNGSLGTFANTAERERAAGAFVRGLLPVLRELRPTFKAYTARTRASVSRIYFCGGTAKLPGLDEQLSRDLSMPVERLKLPMEASAAIPPDDEPVAAQAYALALRGQSSGAKAPRFNLRRGDLAFKGDFDYLREKVGLLASMAAVIFLLVIASGIVRSSVLARRERQLDAILCNVTQRVLGQCEKNFDRALNMLKGKESPAAVLPKASAVTLLAEVSQRLPTDIPLTIDQVVVDLDRVTVRVETDSAKQVDKITSALKTYKCFKEVQEGKVEKTRDGSKVTVRLDIQVACPEEHAPQL